MIKKYRNLIVWVLSIIISSNLLSANQADTMAYNNLFPICVENKVGYMDINGKIVIEPIYNTKFQKSKVVLEDKELESIIFPKNAYFSEGKATVRIATWFFFIPLWYEYGILDSKTQSILLTDYFEPKNFVDGIAVIRIPKRSFAYEYQQTYSFMKIDGSLNITNNYLYAGNFSEGKAVVLNMDDSITTQEGQKLALEIDKYGYINSDNMFIIAPQFRDASDFSEGLAYIKYGEKYGFIDHNAKLVIDTAFKRVWDFKYGFARVFDGEQYHYINKSGENKFNKKFIEASDFSEGLACINIDSTIRYMDLNGNFSFEKGFARGHSFSEGLAGVEDEFGKWGFIDKKGEYVIKPIFDYVEGFNNGLAHGWKDGNMYYINKKGEIVSQVFFEK